MLILSEAELQQVTGFRQPKRQLAELHRLGFWRAREHPTMGGVILERSHYDAVCQGGDRQPRTRPAPQLRRAA